MSNLRICPIDFFRQATLVESPAFGSTTPAANAQLTARGLTARSTSSAAQTIKGHWGGYMRRINSLFVLPAQGGGTVQLQLFANQDYTGSLYDSGAITLWSAVNSGQDWGVGADSFSSVDLLGDEANFQLFFPTVGTPDYLLQEDGSSRILLEDGSGIALESSAAVGVKSFQIDFASCPGSYWDINRIFLGKYVEAPYNPRFGMNVGWKTNSQFSRTNGGSQRARVRARWRELKVDMFTLTDAQRAVWRDLMGYVTVGQDVMVSVFPDATDARKKRDFVFNAQLLDPTPVGYTLPDFNETSYAFSEY